MTLLSRLFPKRYMSASLPKIELLSKPGCHLCDDALNELSLAIGRERIEVVDITTDQELEDEFVFRIPVVRLGRSVIAEGVIDRAEARRVRSHIRNNPAANADSAR